MTRLGAACCAPATRPSWRMGLRFPHPLGLAAGFDKNAVGIDALAALGFGHVEVGTVTGEAQPGNPRPRLFRLTADRAVVNRMGFNNDGAEAVAARLARRAARRGRRRSRARGEHRQDQGGARGRRAAVLADYTKSARRLAPHADYLVVNVSSPNTPGLRNLQAVDAAAAAAARCVRRVADVPLLVKIAPDLADEDIDAVADLGARSRAGRDHRHQHHDRPRGAADRPRRRRGRSAREACRGRRSPLARWRCCGC